MGRLAPRCLGAALRDSGRDGRSGRRRGFYRCREQCCRSGAHATGGRGRRRAIHRPASCRASFRQAPARSADRFAGKSRLGERGMTQPDHFLLRWARLKRDSEARHKADFSGSLPPESAEAISAGAEAAAAQAGTDAAGEEPFDVASLPSVEAIAAETDIRGFLQSRVPAELTRAALRQAWANDPAIRDFIGIAENQWDFNDPNAIPGFGPLLESDNVPDLLAQALGQHDRSAGMIPEVPPSVEQVLPGEIRDVPVVRDQESQQAFDGSPAGSAEDPATCNESVAEED